MDRIEKDFLGGLTLPSQAYWGIQTERARRNFPLSGYRVHPALIAALAQVKKACCLANAETGHLTGPKVAAILQACDEIAAGGLANQFPLDALQGGAGTSTNMNLNEVIANRASELLGGPKGDGALVHPLDDVNRHQSTNDVYPTAIRIAGIGELRRLAPAVAALQGAFQDREKAFGGIVKIGRTELQEAVPLTLGVEFSAFAEALGRDRWRTAKCEERLRVVNLGGTALGTGIAAPREYIFRVSERLREVTGLGLSRGENLAGETANADPFVEVSGILKAHATNLVKIANDLRLLNLLGEIVLPPLQAGSSVMPGKVNPVLLEAAIQTGLKVMGNDGIIADVASRGTLQINEFLPLLAHAFLESLTLLANIDGLLADQVRGIAADEARCRAGFDHSPQIVTALVPAIGYERAAALLAAYGKEEGKTVRAFLEEQLGRERVARAFSPAHLTALGFADDGNDTEGQ